MAFVHKCLAVFNVYCLWSDSVSVTRGWAADFAGLHKEVILFPCFRYPQLSNDETNNELHEIFVVGTRRVYYSCIDCNLCDYWSRQGWLRTMYAVFFF